MNKKVLNIKIKYQRARVAYEQQKLQLYIDEMEEQELIEGARILCKPQTTAQTLFPPVMERSVTFRSDTLAQYGREFERPIINTAAPGYDQNDSVNIKSGSVTNFPVTKSKVFLDLQQSAMQEKYSPEFKRDPTGTLVTQEFMDSVDYQWYNDQRHPESVESNDSELSVGEELGEHFVV